MSILSSNNKKIANVYAGCNGINRQIKTIYIGTSSGVNKVVYQKLESERPENPE
jgi:hypothetical protein